MRSLLFALCIAVPAGAQTTCKFNSCSIKGPVTDAVMATLQKEPNHDKLSVYLSDKPTDADVKALARLPWLTRVALWGGPTTLAPLAALKHLKQIGVHGKGIETLAPLASLVEVEEVDLNDAKVRDIAALRSFTKLTYLDLQYNEVTDISPIAGLKELRRLNLSGVHPTDWKPLAGHPELTMLWIMGGEVRDSSLLAASTKLEELNASSCDFSDIKPLAVMAALAKLDLHNNPKLADLKPLAKLTQLGEVDVTKTAVRDLSPLLASAKSLTKVSAPKAVSAASVQALKKANPELTIELESE
jgi:internalin A